MKVNKLFIIGGVGSVITAICCFTPFLVVVLGALGLSAALGWLDYLLLPLLLVFVLMLLVGIWKRRLN
ncbi:mercury resistance system transport protein MerF [Alphaproteobacteria bacterium]|nr:mercury resistance system transport protein MerF [Alphaproteobacteria bacterium]